MRYRPVLTDPIVDNNPIAVQILGVCSALAVTRTMWPALVMAIAVTVVLVFSNGMVSLLRNVIPRNVRLILEVTLIASAVIVTDEALKAYTPEISATLSVFVGLIITNCIVLGRAETFAISNNVVASVLDGLGNGIGYGALLMAVAMVRELLGSGSLLDRPILAPTDEGGAFVANQFMALPASAFFIVGLVIWALRSWRAKQIEVPQYSEARERP
jgi:Na+-transporting NADH:ubiquinone oxidoreductase subunit D